MGVTCYDPGHFDKLKRLSITPHSSGDESNPIQAHLRSIYHEQYYIQSNNKRGNEVWAAELQAGPVSTGLHLGRAPSAQDIRRWMFSLIGSGVTGISFGFTRAEIMAHEINGYSLLDNEAEDHLGYSTRGWHRLFWERGIPVDFIDFEQLENADSSLDRFVRMGGTLISEACPERFTDWAFSNCGELSPLLRETFGVQHNRLVMVREPEANGRWLPSERTWGEFADAALLKGQGAFTGLRLRANMYIETFHCEGVEAILKFGDQTAGVCRELEQGRAILLGTFVGHSATAYRDGETACFVDRLLGFCGLEAEHPGELLIRKRGNKELAAWVISNPQPRTASQRIEVKGYSKVSDLPGDEVAVHDHQVQVQLAELDVKVLILEK